MDAEGAFALSWQANGLSYGIPREIDDWLAAGEDVLVNGSRGHLAQTRLRNPFDRYVVCLTGQVDGWRNIYLMFLRENILYDSVGSYRLKI